MKEQHISKFILVLFMAFLGCQQTEENIEPDPLISIETIDPAQDATLQELIKGFQPKSSTNGRTLSFDFGDVDFNTALKAINEEDTVVRYSLAMKGNTDLSFENVIFKNKNGEVNAYLMRYESDSSWLVSNNNEFIESSFTGLLYMLNIDRTVIAKVAFVNGHGSQTKDYPLSGGRIECDGEGSTGGGSGGGGGGGSSGGGSTGGGGSGSGGTGGNGGSGGGTSGSGSGSGGGGGGDTEDCTWGIVETTGGLWIDCPGIGLIFARTSGDCDGPTDLDGPIGILPPKALCKSNPCASSSCPNYDPEVCAAIAADLWEEENITLTPAFENNPCAKGVYDALNNNNEVYKLLEDFIGQTPTGELKLDLNPNLLPNKGGRTINNSSGITIELNSNIFDSQSFLSVAQFLLHEYVHAELFNALNTSDIDFADLFNTFADSEVGTTHHNIMINRYVELMGNILSSVDSNQFDIDYYQALSYRGLIKTDFWINNIEGTADESIIESFQAQLLNDRVSCE